MRPSTKLNHWRDGGFKPDNGRLHEFLLDALSCPNLVVLTGTGSSCYIEGFVGMSSLLATVQAVAGYDDVRLKLGYFEEEGKDEHPHDFEKFLTEAQMFASLHADEESKEFLMRAEAMVASECRFVDYDTPVPHHEKFLRSVARRASNLPRTQLFTTNYDRAFEVAASNLGLHGLDGFDFTAKPRFNGANFELDLVRRDMRRELEPVPGVFRLLKVHGSVDWDRKAESFYRTADPENPVLIYPRQGKYEASYEEPFLEMLARFQATLRDDNVAVVVVGYGFRDRHLNNPLKQAVRSNTGLKVVVVDVSWVWEEGKDDLPQLIDDRYEAHQFLKDFVEKGDKRVELVKATFEDFSDEMPLYMTESERERFERK